MTNASGASGVADHGPMDGAVAADSSHAPANRRTVVFVTFSGEERGLLGSQHLIGHLADMGFKREQVVAMLNFDMIGRVRNSQAFIYGVIAATSGGRSWDDLTPLSPLKIATGSSGAGPKRPRQLLRRQGAGAALLQWDARRHAHAPRHGRPDQTLPGPSISSNLARRCCSGCGDEAQGHRV